MTELFPASAGSSWAGVGGGLVFTGGQVPRRPDGSVPAELQDQVELVLDNLERVLATVGCSMSDVIHMRTFAVDRETIKAWVASRGARLGDARPGATSVLVPSLRDPLWRLEVEVVAVAPTADES